MGEVAAVVCEHPCMAQHWLMNREVPKTVLLASVLFAAVGRVEANREGLKQQGAHL